MERGMGKISDWIRPEIKGLQPYVPEAPGPRIRLDANESPYDMPESLKQAILQAFMADSWNRYPDPDCGMLKKAIARVEDVPERNILVGNGSDEIIRDLQICFGGPGTRTVFPTPTFSMYRLLTIALGGTPVGVRLNPDWSLDKENLLKEMASENSRLLFIASPNNPTGKAYDAGILEEILRSTDKLVVVDQAYRLFGGQSITAKLGQYPNLVVLNTFSKSMSAAGLRVGYLLAHPEIVDVLNRVRLPYNLDAFGQVAARICLEHMDVWQANALTVIRERARVAAALQSLPQVTVYPSDANFLLVKLPEADDVKAKLAEADIAVRGFPKTEGLTDCLRVTLGTPEENNALLEAISKVLIQAG